MRISYDIIDLVLILLYIIKCSNLLILSCSLLENINLFCCQGLNMIKVRNLPHLGAAAKEVSEISEIDAVPTFGPVLF